LDAHAILLGLCLELLYMLSQQCLSTLQGIDSLRGISIGALEFGNLGVLLLSELGVVGAARLELGLVPFRVLAEQLDLLLQIGFPELDIVGGALERLVLLF
jgi:hypothetical protein